MRIAEMRTELKNIIDVLDDDSIAEMYSIATNSINVEGDDEWDNLDPEIKAKIEEGIRDLEEGRLIPLEVVMAEIRSKYGLNA
ncbi:hypothetical protein CJD36_005685 [Flavipsychrobacter stenotrophus]|uniref:Uncharacterized protein n=1 Tax=Flavipsychrobacter stenotrophus TaxID=2077091 RepID=A0A2S7SX33_9BACT|nr:hypothetical protein [Flavipsychrobacter stenotrophus]PQJ11294.1 hypothetical protein CJD36_005685 [Flavipsychrobacter stenotrophus]